MKDFTDWALRWPQAGPAQAANLRLFWDQIDENDRLLLRALSPLALRPEERGVRGPLGEAFARLCRGPREKVWGDVLRRARSGDYPEEALRLLLLQERGEEIDCQHLRERVCSVLGVWPEAHIYILPAWAYRARAAELHFPLAFYRPDSIYAEEGTSEQILLHELVHSAQSKSAGRILPPNSKQERLALAMLEALTEEWASRHGGGDLYRAERDHLCAEQIDYQKLNHLVLESPETIFDALWPALSKNSQERFSELVL